ncbi:hypothetical protein BCR33DRAFT_724468 [Rhizoclosmatium globosum]|uniref:Uncharacterized protein n=1 Tax=Rhizoclosmatium globosum TaxID=329046 RepID=A0A1Y2B5Y3_9FUNG|nr:hypothetical protein BCR33DRAFT_724468 [Rhizoclosmatium globosum]|eukprot:ORY30144.1 hypothetical protein BCR33DRAFT_724468 [Rhizoclosmatium globosum]
MQPNDRWPPTPAQHVQKSFTKDPHDPDSRGPSQSQHPTSHESNPAVQSAAEVDLCRDHTTSHPRASSREVQRSAGENPQINISKRYKTHQDE